MAYVGQTLWLSQMPALGPIPGVVLRVDGATVDVVLLHGLAPYGAEPLSGVTPWDVEDGSSWGWSVVPADGAVPEGHFAPGE